MSDRPVSSPVVRESNLIEALESSPDAVTVFDFEFRILYLNDVARRYLSDGGIDARDVIGRVAWEAMPAREPPTSAAPKSTRVFGTSL